MDIVISSSKEDKLENELCWELKVASFSWQFKITSHSLLEFHVYLVCIFIM